MLGVFNEYITWNYFLLQMVLISHLGSILLIQIIMLMGSGSEFGMLEYLEQQ